jgi:hypothetical protein
MWKVPFRQVYCDLFLDMVRQTFWCHVVIRVFPRAVDLASDALHEVYRDRPEAMYEQYQSFLGQA